MDEDELERLWGHDRDRELERLFDRDDDFVPVGRAQPRKRCVHCGLAGLTWLRTVHGWRLTPDGVTIHDCQGLLDAVARRRDEPEDDFDAIPDDE